MRVSHKFLLSCRLVLLLAVLIAPFVAGESFAKGVVRLYEVHDTQCSGLLFLLDRAFSLSTDVRVDWRDATQLEKSELFRLAGEGEMHALLTNDETLIDELTEKGLVRLSGVVMRNPLFLAGPGEDPAGALDLPPERAFARIAETGSLFISPLRGGWFTSVESKLWERAGVANPETLKGYVSSGRARLGAMMQAGDEGGYILTDSATFATYGGAFASGSSALRLISPLAGSFENRYFFVIIERGALSGQGVQNAEALYEWLRSTHARQIISSYNLSGHHPFAPWSEGR